MSHVLLVDDDPDILHILAAALECAGHEVHTTPDPVEVVPLTHRHDFDAVVLDVMMPRRSGWEVLEELRRDPHTLHLPVLMLSAIGDAANRVRGLRMGADDFLGKPFHPEEVIVRVEGLLSRRAAEVRGLQGDFATVTAADILQSLEHGATSGDLEVRTPGGEGRFRLREGRCVAASFAGLTGAEALTALLGEQEGDFRLRGQGGSAGGEGGDGVALPPLSSLLLEAAWIQDELRPRHHLLPPAGAPLYAREGPPPMLPPGLPDLPLAAVAQTLQSRPGLSLEGLLAARLAAPERLRLAVACLLEQGVVTPEAGPGPGAEPGEDDLAPLLGELAEECRLRGLATDPLEVAVLVHPGSWRAVAPLLASLPARGGVSPANGAGRLLIPHPAGSLALQIRTLAEGPEPGGPGLGRCAAVVLWLGERPGDAARAVAAIERQADPRAFLLAISPRGRGPLPERRLRVVRQAPADLAGLLADLLSPLADDDGDA